MFLELGGQTKVTQTLKQKNERILKNNHPQDLVVATNNTGKISEIRELVKFLPYQVIPIGECLDNFFVEEDGSTYAENAMKKAEQALAETGKICLADDSGLEVDALDGAPGIYSARFGGEDLSQPEKNALLLAKLQGVTQRAARFRCVIAVAWPDGRRETVEGVCEGTISAEPRGTHGFGFDPVFFLSDYQKTMAELSANVKNNISHRAQALKQLPALLNRTSQAAE